MLYIDKDSILNTLEIANYKVKIWLDESADSTYMNKTFTARLVVETGQIATITLNANEGVVSTSTKEISASSNTEFIEPVFLANSGSCGENQCKIILGISNHNNEMSFRAYTVSNGFVSVG